VQTAEGAVAVHPRFGWYLYTLALAHYRAGRLDEALGRLRESLEVDPGWEAQVLDWLLLALVQQRRGETEDARRWLDKAVRWSDEARQRMPPGAPVPLPVNWHDYLEAQVLRQQAEAALPARGP
jgi:tetratricopeptide (TPR) repeat protein